MKDSMFGVINQKITRRSFVKWSAAIGATASASGLVMNSALKGAGAATPPSTLAAPVTAGKVVEWVPTHCLMCHSWCGLAVGLDADGHIVKIEGCGGQPAAAPSRVNSTTGAALTGTELNGGVYKFGGVWGNPDDGERFPSVADGYLPYHLNNKGRICAKGNNGMQHVYDPDRVKYPLKRRSGTARGAGKWVKISWRQAYWEIASALRELHGYTTAPDGTTALSTVLGYAPRQRDLRHRHVLYVGRNEANAGLKFGTMNHIEHTSLCESSRHQSTLTLYGHHFPFPDLNTHTGRRASSDGDADVDFMLEVGGNPCESKIPHSSYAVRWGDRRRRGARIVAVDVRQSNTAAFADEWLAVEPGTDGALAMGIMGVMFRQVTAATLKTQLLAGHLGGENNDYTSRRFVGIFADEVGGASFVPSNGNGAGSQTFTTSGVTVTAPAESLEGELVAMFGSAYDGVGGSTTQSPEAWAASVTGLTSADIVYLAGAVGGATFDGTGAITSWAGVPTYRNPSIDGYRGPSKHTNGTYSWRALRVLQVICGKFQVDANGIFDPTQTSGTWARGGIERPGGLIINGWGANNAGTGAGDYSIAAQLGGSGGVGPASLSLDAGVTDVQAKMAKHTYPYASNKWNGEFDIQTIDRWDYDRGRTKFGIGTQGVDQNVVPAIRASLGLHPYKVGSSVTVSRTSADGTGSGKVVLPYGWRQTHFAAAASAGTTITVGAQTSISNITAGDAVTVYGDAGSSLARTVASVDAGAGTITVNAATAVAIGDHVVVDLADAGRPDPDFQIETLLTFKNAPGNTRANIKLAQELATSGGVGAYKLRHIWAIDCYMGDFTRFADIVLPDTTYLERYDDKDWENMGLKGHFMLRQSTMRKDMSKAIYDPAAKDLYLYESRPINTIARELSNAVAGKKTTDANGGWSGYTSADVMWSANATDEDYNPTIAGTEGQPWDALPLGGIGAYKQFWYNKIANGATPELATASSSADTRQYAWMRVFGNVYDSTQVIDEYTGYDSSFNMGKHYSAKTKVGDAGGGARFPALEVYNRRMTQVLDPGFDYGTGTLPSDMDAVGYKFRGVPTYQRAVEETNATYGLHLTTYKLNVHTQSRTAANPRQTEIIGNNWAVMHPTTAAANGSIVNGDTVKVETAQGWVQLEAKVTTKIKAGVIAISNSFGHEAKGQDPNSVGSSHGTTTLYGDTDAFGRYRVQVSGTEYDNRASAAKASKNDAFHGTGTGLGIGSVSDYTIGTPSAPGSGVHPNHAIQRTVRDLGTSASLATDPIGTSMAWMDSKCKISKLT